MERNWKDTKHVYDKKRNRTKAKKREKLISRYNILGARHGFLEPGQVDPHVETQKYGAPVELIDPLTSEPAGADGNAAIRVNAFKAYPAADEQDCIMEPEEPGSTARFKLLDKFKGMKLVDEDEDPPEHRVILDLEWQSRRPKNWQGAKNAWKQWLAYTELDSNYHQDRLDKEDIKETCYSYIIDKNLYDMILAAPEAEQPRKIEKLEDMEEDDEDENEEHGD